MNQHIVLMKLKSDAAPEAIEAARDGLAALQTTIPGILAFRFGRNDSPEGRNQGFDLGFTIDFVDSAARDAYLPHPDHQAVIPLVLKIVDDVLIFDFES